MTSPFKGALGSIAAHYMPRKWQQATRRAFDRSSAPDWRDFANLPRARLQDLTYFDEERRLGPPSRAELALRYWREGRVHFP